MALASVGGKHICSLYPDRLIANQFRYLFEEIRSLRRVTKMRVVYIYLFRFYMLNVQGLKKALKASKIEIIALFRPLILGMQANISEEVLFIEPWIYWTTLADRSKMKQPRILAFFRVAIFHQISLKISHCKDLTIVSLLYMLQNHVLVASKNK